MLLVLLVIQAALMLDQSCSGNSGCFALPSMIVIPPAVVWLGISALVARKWLRGGLLFQAMSFVASLVFFFLGALSGDHRNLFLSWVLFTLNAFVVIIVATIIMRHPSRVTYK